MKLSWLTVFVLIGVSVLAGLRPVEAQPLDLRRGDADLNGRIDLTDSVRILGFLFLGSRLDTCLAVTDVTANGQLELTDAIFLLNHLFLGAAGPTPLSGFDNRLCQDPDAESVAEGEIVYSTPDPGMDGIWAFSCSTCHDSVPVAQRTTRRPGHTLHDAVRRPTFKNGRVADFLGAANVCRVDWMLASRWTDDSEDFLDLVSYLHSLSPVEPVSTYTWELSVPSVTGPSNGDAVIGCGVFHDSCSRCHGENGAGTDAGPALFFPELGEVLYTPDFVREKVRLSGPTGTVYDDLIGGQMPFWTQEQLSDVELEQVVAYLMQTEPTPCP